MKVNFQWVALVFGTAFLIFSAILYAFMIRSVQSSQAVAKSELSRSKATYLEKVPSHNHGIELGGMIYVNQCASCHGSKATGGVGPALIRSEWDFEKENVRYIVNWIQKGSENGAMPAFSGRIRDEDIAKVVSYIEAMNAHVRGNK